jgi:hypothetical protein
VCARQQDTGEERQPPDPAQPHALPPPSSRSPRRSYILLTFRPPRRPLPDAPVPRTERPPASEPPTASSPETTSQPETASEPDTASPPTTANPPRTTSDSPPRNDAPRPVARARTSGNASTGTYVTRWVDASMIVIGAALFLGALATLTSTWAWSWHASSGAVFTLSQVHGICTSAMGELAQGASGTVSNNCLWVDLTWTEAAALTAGGCILAAIGVVRIGARLRAAAIRRG